MMESNVEETQLLTNNDDEVVFVDDEIEVEVELQTMDLGKRSSESNS